MQWIVSMRWPLFGLAVLLGICAWPAAHRVTFDRSIENMFAPDDPLLVKYQEMEEQFGESEIVMAVYKDSHLLDADGQGIQRLQ